MPSSKPPAVELSAAVTHILMTGEWCAHRVHGWVALAWCAGIELAGYQWARSLFRRGRR